MENCKGNLNDYCYVCGQFKVSTQLRSEGCSSVEFQSLYSEYFGLPFIVDEWYVPKSLCKTCYNTMFEWKNSNGKRQMDFGIPMVWSEPKKKQHDPADCYACVNFVPGANKKRMRNYKYKSVDSALTPVEHSVADIPFKYPSPDEDDDSSAIYSSSEHSSDTDLDDTDPLFNPPPGAVGPQRLSQEQFDFLVRKIRLTPEKAKFLASFFNKHRALVPGVTTATQFMKKKKDEPTQSQPAAAATSEAKPAAAASVTAPPPAKKGRNTK